MLASIVADVSKKIQADRAGEDAPTRPGATRHQVKPRSGHQSIAWSGSGRVGGAAFGHQSGGFLLRLDEGHAVDDHGHVIRVDVPELGGRGRLMGQSSSRRCWPRFSSSACKLGRSGSIPSMAGWLGGSSPGPVGNWRSPGIRVGIRRSGASSM